VRAEVAEGAKLLDRFGIRSSSRGGAFRLASVPCQGFVDRLPQRGGDGGFFIIRFRVRSGPVSGRRARRGARRCSGTRRSRWRVGSASQKCCGGRATRSSRLAARRPAFVRGARRGCGPGSSRGRSKEAGRVVPGRSDVYGVHDLSDSALRGHKRGRRLQDQGHVDRGVVDEEPVLLLLCSPRPSVVARQEIMLEA